jgi:hypothetical protein
LINAVLYSIKIDLDIEKTGGLITKGNSMKRNPQQTDNWIRIHSYIVVA